LRDTDTNPERNAFTYTDGHSHSSTFTDPDTDGITNTYTWSDPDADTWSLHRY
jgi:hypothetical protein